MGCAGADADRLPLGFVHVPKILKLLFLTNAGAPWYYLQKEMQDEMKVIVADVHTLTACVSKAVGEYVSASDLEALDAAIAHLKDSR